MSTKQLKQNQFKIVQELDLRRQISEALDKQTELAKQLDLTSENFEERIEWLDINADIFLTDEEERLAKLYQKYLDVTYFLNQNKDLARKILLKPLRN